MFLGKDYMMTPVVAETYDEVGIPYYYAVAVVKKQKYDQNPRRPGGKEILSHRSGKTI